MRIKFSLYRYALAYGIGRSCYFYGISFYVLRGSASAINSD